VIGIDLVDIEEFRRQLLLGGERFLRRAFHEHELVDQDAARLAGLWAPKEAVVKASLTPPGRFADVTIANDGSGRCYGASFTASSLNSGVNLRRVLPIVDILSCKVSTKWGQGHALTSEPDYSEAMPVFTSSYGAELTHRVLCGPGDPVICFRVGPLRAMRYLRNLRGLDER
jgi:hypothetical protein